MNGLELESLLADKRNLEQILDNLMEGIIAHDKSRRILFFNRAAEAITGFRKEDVVGKDCHEVLGGPFCGSRCSFCGEAPATLTHLSYPLNILTRSGEPRRLEMSVTGMTDEKGCFVGVLAAFRDLTDLIGRKKMYTWDLLAFVILSLLMLIVQTPLQIVILRFLMGIAIGADYPIATALLTEYAPKRHRAFMLGILMAMFFLGSMAATVVGYFFIDVEGAWRWMMVSPAVLATILIIGRIGTPESPRWLLSKGRTEEALANVKKVYGESADLSDLDQEIVETKLTKLLEPGYLKRLIYECGFWMCQIVPLFGIYTFGPTILSMFGLAEGKQAMLGEVLISFVFLVGVVAMIRESDRFGRRPLMIWSFILMTIGMAILAAFPYASPWVIALGFTIYAFFYRSNCSNCSRSGGAAVALGSIAARRKELLEWQLREVIP